MKTKYIDILSRVSEEPSWFDDNGTPRYGDFKPELAPNLYAEEVVLYLIKCQACDKEFKVTKTWDRFCHNKFGLPCIQPSKSIPELYYGDPPNISCCSTGPTMTSDSIKVLEFWSKKNHKWIRFNHLEVNLIEVHL